MKNFSSFRKANLLTLTSIASLLFLFSCSEDNQEDLIGSELETTNFSQAMSSSSVKLDIPTMTASATKSGYSASNANDDNYSTKWRADGTGINLIADLGSTKPVDYIMVSHSSGTSRVYSFEVWTRETSSSSWVTHGHKTSPGNSSSTVAYDINDVNARYVRIKCNGNNSNNRNEVKKFEVWGSDSGSSSNNSGTSGSGTFELGEFGIETSSSCSSSTSTTTNSDTELNDGEKYTKNGLDYYERDGDEYILTSCDQDGRRTEWKQSSKFALSNSRKMSYNAKFEDYPSDGVTIAQVHNRGDAGRPLLRAEIAHGKIEFVIVDTYVKNSGNSYTIVGPSYTEGSYLDLSLEAGSDKIIAKVTTTSGSKTVTYTKTNSDVKKKINSKWFESGVKNDFYFKAGVYNDSGNNSDNPIGTFSEFTYDN